MSGAPLPRPAPVEDLPLAFLERLEADEKCCALLRAHIEMVDDRLQAAATAAQDALHKTLVNVRDLQADDDESVQAIENLVIDATDFLQNCDIIRQYIAMTARFSDLAREEFAFLRGANGAEEERPPLEELFVDCYHSEEQREIHRRFFDLEQTAADQGGGTGVELF